MIEQRSDGLVVTAPMLIGNATALLEAGRSRLQKGEGAGAGTIVFDLSSVAATDSSALSVVFGWLRTARENGVTMRIAHPPASMISQAELYGVSESLPLA